MKLVIKEVYLNLGIETIKSKQESLNLLIAGCKEKLMMLGASTPRTIEDDKENPINWIDHVQFEVNSIFEELDEYIYEKHLVETALASPDQVETWDN